MRLLFLTDPRNEDVGSACLIQPIADRTATYLIVIGKTASVYSCTEFDWSKPAVNQFVRGARFIKPGSPRVTNVLCSLWNGYKFGIEIVTVCL